MKRFALGIIAGCIGVLGGLAASYAALALLWPDSFPAPPLTREAGLDEKLRFLREHPRLDPTILAVGSSITWRQVAGTPFERLAGGPGRFLNGATGGLQIHQTHDLLDFYLDHYPNVRSVLILTGLPDFADCTNAPAAMLNHAAAASYAFERWPSAYFYLRYFAPQRFIRTAMTLAERRKPLIGDLYLDADGAAPLQVPEAMQRGLRYQQIDTDAACIDEMAGISRDLTKRGIHLVVVFPPVNPLYQQTYPDAIPQICRIADRIAQQTRGLDIRLLLLPDDGEFDETDFFDAFHLQNTAVQRLSARIASEMEHASRLGAIKQVGTIPGEARKASGFDRSCLNRRNEHRQEALSDAFAG
ncbi:MAG TPA: hypothetical protein VF194_05745 [Ferrovibrio sp.]|uniref:hypothetical protein n=1 Tax=Ferrovibrio sp. TaxID=1917215 RepID=UPI002ED6A3B3